MNLWCHLRFALEKEVGVLVVPLFTLDVLWGQREAGRKKGAQSVSVYSDGFVSRQVVCSMWRKCEQLPY